MKKIIWLAGLKGTWKDFSASLLSNYESFAIADSVKLESARKLGYLEKDDLTVLKHFDYYKDIIRQELKEQKTSFSIDMFEKEIINTKTNSLPDSLLLLKVNIYKNINTLKTRESLYSYFQVEKEFGYEHVSKMAFKIILKKEGNIIITDIRTLLEAIDLLLNNGLLINVYNSRSIDYYKNMKIFHFSEYEVSAPLKNWEFIGFSIDVTSRDSNYLKKIFNEVEQLFFNNDNKYSKTFIKELQKLRIEILKDDKIKKIEDSIASKFKQIKDKRNFNLIKGYEEEIKKLDSYRNKLSSLIKEEYERLFIFK